MDADFEGDEWELGEGQLHYQIVEDCFEALTPDEAVVLVGLLFSCRIKLTREQEPLGPKEEQIDISELSPLEPGAAADLVGGLYHFDRRMLLERFELDWGDLADSSVAMRIKKRLETHPQVEALERNQF